MQALTIVMIGPDLQGCKLYKSLLASSSATQAARPAPSASSQLPHACSNALTLCPACRRAGRHLQVFLCAERFEDAHPSLLAADLVMLFHPGLAATNSQVIEDAASWDQAERARGDAAGAAAAPAPAPAGSAASPSPARASALAKRVAGRPPHGHESKRRRGHGAGIRGKGVKSSSSSGGSSDLLGRVADSVMPCLGKAWVPCLGLLRASAAPVFVTAFSHAGVLCLVMCTWRVCLKLPVAGVYHAQSRL